MNKITVLIIVVIAAVFGVYRAFALNSTKEVNMNDKKVLIAYYSHSGNTKAAAVKIQQVTGGDLFEIKPVQEYPQDYNSVVNQAKKEKENNVKPALISKGNVEKYDVIFIGTPVWWYTMSSPVRTFIAENNFDGKTIVPFCTHGGGGASSTYADMQKLAPNAKVLEGYTSYENSAKSSDIENWIKKLKI